MTPATLQAPLHTADALGGEVLAWGAPIRVLADARQISSRRKLAADLPLTDSVWTIKIRWRAGITRGWRVTLLQAGRQISLDIIGDPEDQGGKRQWLILTAQTATAEAMAQADGPPPSVIPVGAMLIGGGSLTLPAGELVLT
jgi:head-tail adaptor